MMIPLRKFVCGNHFGITLKEEAKVMDKTVLQSRRKRFLALVVSLLMLTSLLPLPENLGGDAKAFGSYNAQINNYVKRIEAVYDGTAKNLVTHESNTQLAQYWYAVYNEKKLFLIGI